MKKLIVILLLISVTNLFAQEDTEVKKVNYPKGYESQIDVVYSKGNNYEVKHDIYYNPTAAKPTPVVFNIHGGGWFRGSKNTQTGFGSFFKMGYAVVNVGYRLTPQATAPAAIEDVRASMLYIVKHAKELNIDPNKIVMMGSSAGAHLALLAGFLQDDKLFDGQNNSGLPFTVAAIVDKYGPADFETPELELKKFKSLLFWLGDKATDKKFIASVSPLTYVKKTSPPVFIVHGDADTTVPYQQSVTLHKKLTDLGVRTEFVTINGGGHGNFGTEKSAEVSSKITAFLQSLNINK